MIAVVLLGFGSPEKIEDVGAFVEGVAGRPLPPERLAASIQKYALIGGVSPFCASARAQAERLEERFGRSGKDIKVYLGMRYSDPTIDGAIKSVLDAAPDKIVLICLTPYYSVASAGEYLRAAESALAAGDNAAPVVRIDQWNEEPALVAGFADVLIEALGNAPAGSAVLFTAHSLPQSVVDSGDPYRDQVMATTAVTAEAAGLRDWHFGWQSEGHGRGEWLQPTAAVVLSELAAAGTGDVIIMPIGFTSDHLETLYDIDIEMKQQALELGMNFTRADCLDESDALISAMAAAVGRKLEMEVG